MKRIKIIVAVVVLVMLAIELPGGCRGFVKGMNEAGDDTTFTTIHFYLPVQPTAQTVPDTLHTTSADHASLPYYLHHVGVTGREIALPWWGTALHMLSYPLALLMLAGLVCLVWMVVRVCRGEVFSRRNVRLMRVFIYSLLVFSLNLELYRWVYACRVREVVQPMEGYVIAPFSLDHPWLLLVLLALFVEIFAAGVKLKEEQDLTI